MPVLDMVAVICSRVCRSSCSALSSGTGLLSTSCNSAAPCAGDTYLVLDRSLRDVAAHLAASVQSGIRVRWPVTSVRRDAGGVTLQGPAGRCASVYPLVRQSVLHTTFSLHVLHVVHPR